MERLLVINGCSHSAGSEIPGPLVGDGIECRENCFGATLAKKLNRKPVHLAVPGASNDYISRSTASWVADHLAKINNNEIDVIFLIHWTSSERWEFRLKDYTPIKHFIDYDIDKFYKSFTINQDATYAYGFQKKLYNFFQRAFTEDPEFWSDNKIKNIIFIQELFKNNNCRYWFGNAFDTFRTTPTYESLIKLLDTKYYPHLTNYDMSYYWMGRNHGFNNQSEIIWHLGKEAHDFYANFLELEFKKVGLDI